MRHNVKSYSFKTWRERDGWWLAEVKLSDGGTLLTQGKNKEEILLMVADLIMCLEDIEISWWNKLLSRLQIFKFKK